MEKEKRKPMRAHRHNFLAVPNLILCVCVCVCVCMCVCVCVGGAVLLILGVPIPFLLDCIVPPSNRVLSCNVVFGILSWQEELSEMSVLTFLQ